MASEDERTPQAAGSGTRSIAVLALANLSGDPDQEHFADGMTDALITELAKIRALSVTSRTSVMPYKGAPQSLRQVAEELGAGLVVEGGVVHWPPRESGTMP